MFHPSLVPSLSCKEDNTMLNNSNNGSTTLPRTVVAQAKPVFKFNLAWWLAKRAGRIDIIKSTPAVDNKKVLMRWEGWGPAGKMESANLTATDVAAIDDADHILRGRNAFFSPTRARQAITYSSAAGRAIALNRAPKRKVGVYLGDSDVAAKRISKITPKIEATKKEVAALRKFLDQRYKGKRLIKPTERAEVLKVFKGKLVRLKGLEKRLAKWNLVGSF